MDSSLTNPSPIIESAATEPIAKPSQNQIKLGIEGEIKTWAAFFKMVGIDALTAVAMVVDAISQGAASFYKDYGFIEFPDDPMKLYISMVEIEKLGL